MKKLRVIFTMDCEAIEELSAEGGPKDWELCKHSMVGYCELLQKKGFPATLFVVPNTAHKHSGILLELEKKGVELALHYHPQDHGYTEYLGAYDKEQQMDMLKKASGLWAQAIGKNPESFRSGNFSANDSTFPALEALGFRQGSTSLPGRNFTKLRANWSGSSMNPYHANKANRLIGGSLELLEVPLTVDWESSMWGGLTPLELRIEMVDAKSHGFTIRKNIDRQLKDSSPLPYISVMTHSIFDYSDKSEFRAQVLEGIIAELDQSARINDMALEGVTLEKYHTLFDQNE